MNISSSANNRGNRRAASVLVLALLSSTGLPMARSAAEAQRLDIENESVAVGATEITTTIGLAPGYTLWSDASTFYSPSVTQVGQSYYLWTHTGWESAGCPQTHPQEGLDNVVVFQSSSPQGPFYPRGCSSPSCGGGLSAAEMRASLVTDTGMLGANQNTDQCDNDWMWGLGDVIPFGGRFLATYDLSKNGLKNGPGDNDHGDFAKYHLYFSVSDGKDRTSRMFLLAETTPQQVPRKAFVEPVPFAIDSDTVGILFESFDGGEAARFGNVGTGYMYVDFVKFPNLYTVWVLAADGTYRRLDAGNGYAIDFQLGSVGNQGLINRVAKIGGQWRAFFDRPKNGATRPVTCPDQQPNPNDGNLKSSELGFRELRVTPGGRWGGWRGSRRKIHLSSGDLKEWDFLSGLMYPSPLLDADGSIHLYFTQDNQCRGGFAYLDVMHADMHEAHLMDMNEALVPGNPLFFDAPLGIAYNGWATSQLFSNLRIWDQPPANTDGKWDVYDTSFLNDSGPNYNCMHGHAGEDLRSLDTTFSGLTPLAYYDVYVDYQSNGAVPPHFGQFVREAGFDWKELSDSTPASGFRILESVPNLPEWQVRRAKLHTARASAAGQIRLETDNSQTAAASPFDHTKFCGYYLEKKWPKDLITPPSQGQ